MAKTPSRANRTTAQHRIAHCALKKRGHYNGHVRCKPWNSCGPKRFSPSFALYAGWGWVGNPVPNLSPKWLCQVWLLRRARIKSLRSRSPHHLYPPFAPNSAERSSDWEVKSASESEKIFNFRERPLLFVIELEICDFKSQASRIQDRSCIYQNGNGQRRVRNAAGTSNSYDLESLRGTKHSRYSLRTIPGVGVLYLALIAFSGEFCRTGIRLQVVCYTENLAKRIGPRNLPSKHFSPLPA